MPARRRPTRWLAPIAIVTVAAAGYGIARSASRDDGEQADRTATTRTTKRTTTRDRQTTTPQRTGRRTYLVKAGDTLSAISLDTGVPVGQLEQLNKDIDVQALQPGTRLKLRR